MHWHIGRAVITKLSNRIEDTYFQQRLLDLRYTAILSNAITAVQDRTDR